MFTRLNPRHFNTMNLFFKPNFNTAIALATAALCALSGVAHAQSHTTVCETQHINNPNDLGVRFLPHEPAFESAQAEFKKSLWPILPADETSFWSVGSRILTQAPNNEDVRQHLEHSFFVVRITPVKPNPYKPVLGQFIQIIGTADAKAYLSATSFAAAPTFALNITHATKEITAHDYLVPMRCMPLAMVAHTWLEGVTDVTQRDATAVRAPQVIAFLEEPTIAARGAIALIDQGLNDGVVRAQKWRFIDELPNQPASAKAFGNAEIVESFANMSLIRIDESSHEVRIGTSLRMHHEK